MFGSDAYVHVHGNKGKLDDTARKGIYVGQSIRSPGSIQVFFLDTNTIVDTVHVSVHEPSRGHGTKGTAPVRRNLTNHPTMPRRKLLPILQQQSQPQ